MGAFDGMTGTSSFGALRFWKAQDSARTLPRRGRAARIQRDQIPFGDNATVQIGGTDPKPVQIQALIKEADWAAFLAAVGTVATLAILGDTAIAAVLSEVGDGAAYPDDAGVLATTLTFTP